jgi:hypothetical protein
MTRKPLTAALVAAALSLPALSAAAQGAFVSPPPAAATETPLRGVRAAIARELPRFGYPDVDVRRLGPSQVAHIHYFVFSNRSQGDIRGAIGATLRRGLLQRGLERVIR